MRFLEEDDHAHEEQDDHGHEEEESEKSLLGIKITIIVLLIIGGLFVFFPYTQVKSGDSK